MRELFVKEVFYMDKISIIVPVYNEEEAIKIFYDKITEVSDKIDKILE